MSWEVLTMRSATSFFNPALARSDLRRYWPALFLYVGCGSFSCRFSCGFRHDGTIS